MPRKHKPTGRPPGRPARINETDTRQRFFSALRSGAWIDEAALTAGWSDSSVASWLVRGRRSVARCAAAEAREGEPDESWQAFSAEPDEPWHTFAVEVDRAIAEHEVLLLGLVRRAATGAAPRRGR